MKKMINKVTIEGYLYQHDLKLKTVQNKSSQNFGKEFISGSIEIATDEDMLNVVKVSYTYVTERTAKNEVNKTYNVLKQIIDGAPVAVTVGKDAALKIKATPAVALNDFYNKENKLVSTMKLEGGFLEVLNTFGEVRNKFETDMLITGVRTIEADDEKNTPEKRVLKGAIFDFRGTLLPVEFSVTSEGGMKYCDTLDNLNVEPIFTKVWGKILSSNIVTERKEDNAFGEPTITKFTKTVKDWIITGIQPTFYDFGDEAVLTAAEVVKATQDREVYLADVKKRQDEYAASKNLASTATAAIAAAPAGNSASAFNF